MKWTIYSGVLLLMFASATAAFAKDSLAILPFTGGQGEDGETIAEIFSFEKDLNAFFLRYRAPLSMRLSGTSSVSRCRPV